MNSTIITISDAVPAAAVSQHEPCPSWCTSHDNHLEDESGRYHFGPERTVTLTLEKAQICQTADGEPVVFPSELTAYLEQRDQHREARINLSRDGGYGIYLTLAEARELAEALAKVLHEAASSS